jgi:hypothetical protein
LSSCFFFYYLRFLTSSRMPLSMLTLSTRIYSDFIPSFSLLATCFNVAWLLILSLNCLILIESFAHLCSYLVCLASISNSNGVKQIEGSIVEQTWCLYFDILAFCFRYSRCFLTLSFASYCLSSILSSSLCITSSGSSSNCFVVCCF